MSMFGDTPIETVQVEERSGRFFVIVSEGGKETEHGPMTRDAAENMRQREGQRLRGKPRS